MLDCIVFLCYYVCDNNKKYYICDNNKRYLFHLADENIKKGDETFRYIGEHNHLSELRFKNKGCVGSWCPCGQYTVCEHNVVNDDCSCASCGIYLHDFHINLLHFTSTYHYKVCSKCNYSVAEEHIMRPKPSGLYCEICGYDTTSSGEITLGTGEHTH